LRVEVEVADPAGDENVGDSFATDFVVLVHGFTGNSRNWALTVPALRERFRTVSVDLRDPSCVARGPAGIISLSDASSLDKS
jgi:pimeloyl-ACP methyl ester carboxylesterase